MAKAKVFSSNVIIGVITLIFLIILGVVFFVSYRLAQNTTTGARQELTEASRQQGEDYQQVRRVKLTHKDTGESMEILMDGTVNYYDKTGKLIKTGRRGFAETQNIFKQYEWLINSNRDLNGGDYYVEIETQKGIINYGPGDGGGDDLIDDTVDFVDQTVNPTPTPTPVINPSATPTPFPFASPSPTPSPLPEMPDYLSAPPFDCSDYYQVGGKPLKISNTYCGIE
jgi:hypothetical protein